MLRVCFRFCDENCALNLENNSNSILVIVEDVDNVLVLLIVNLSF